MKPADGVDRKSASKQNEIYDEVYRSKPNDIKSVSFRKTCSRRKNDIVNFKYGT